MPNRVVARNGGRWGVAALVAILLLGLGLRVGEAWDGRVPVYDATAYAAIARNLDQGNGFTVGARATQPSSDYSPGLPLLVAGLYEVTGGVHERLAREVLAVIGTLAILFTYLLGRRMKGVVAGLIAALVVAIYPATIEYTGMLMTEPLAATLLAGAILAIPWAGDGDSLWRWLVPGLTLGALALVRPEYLAIGLLLALLVLLHERFASRSQLAVISTGKCERTGGGWRRAVIAAAVVVLGLVIVVAPWTVRNAFALHRFVSVSTGGGQVLYAGTYLPSDGDPEKVGAAVVAEHPGLFGPHAVEHLRLEQILARLGEHTYPELEPDQALSKMGKEQLGDDITEHTGAYIGFVAEKIGRIWSHGPRAVMREPLWEALHWALLGLGLLGLALLAWRRRWEALLIGAVFLPITLISALLVASPRRVLVLVPLLAACTGTATVWLAAGARALPRRGRPDEQVAD
ncbi:MAG TPA: glycosyltransferase family 39 protein [Solirubrobacterales bacterium]|nr:glycosyltransferase family 39 protein [Solirubrobacterales bacterium]